MKNFILRMIIFISAAALTIALPRLPAGELSRQSWMAVGFLIAAEALTCLPGSMMNKGQFPFFLPVRFVVFPGYLAATLILAAVNSFLSWNWLLALELVLCFVVIVSLCIAGMCGKSEEDLKK